MCWILVCKAWCGPCLQVVEVLMKLDVDFGNWRVFCSWGLVVWTWKLFIFRNKDINGYWIQLWGRFLYLFCFIGSWFSVIPIFKEELKRGRKNPRNRFTYLWNPYLEVIRLKWGGFTCYRILKIIVNSRNNFILLDAWVTLVRLLNFANKFFSISVWFRGNPTSLKIKNMDHPSQWVNYSSRYHFPHTYYSTF